MSGGTLEPQTGNSPQCNGGDDGVLNEGALPGAWCCTEVYYTYVALAINDFHVYFFESECVHREEFLSCYVDRQVNTVDTISVRSFAMFSRLITG